MKVKKTKPYISKKGRYKDGERKYIIEENGIQLGVLPKVEILIPILRQYGLSIKPYPNDPKIALNPPQRFAHELLDEPLKRDDIREKYLTEDEMTKLWEITK